MCGNFRILDPYLDKDKTITYLEEKVSELQENEEKKDGDYEKGMQEKEQEMVQMKTDILLLNGHNLEKESEAEELRNEFSLLKGDLDRCNT